MVSRLSRLILALTLNVLAGCSTLPPTPASQVVWSGRFAIEGEPNLEPTSGRFTLERNGEQRKLDLISPLGQILARVEIDSQGATLKHADGRIEAAPDSTSLLERALGWRLPVEQISNWLDGTIAGVRVRDAAGRPTLAVDEQWLIRIEPPRRWWLEWPADRNQLPAYERNRRVLIRLVLDQPD